MNRNEAVEFLRDGAKRIDVHTHVGMDPANFARGDYPYAQSAEDLVVRLDRWGIDAAVCFPFLYTSYFDMDAFVAGRLVKADSRVCPAPYALENERLCDEINAAYPQCAGRLLPFAFFDPGREQAAQCDALRDLCGRYPLFGLKTATSYLRSHVTDLLGAGACLLDFAASRGLPVMIHSAVAPGDPWAAVEAILKVVRARPEVRFCIAHTCRFDRPALEAADRLPNCFVDFSAFIIHCELARRNDPAVAAAERRFPADYDRPAEVLARIAAAYPETMLWGTDSPYYCFMGRYVDDAGKTVVWRLACDTDDDTSAFRRLPPPVRQTLAHDNTMRYLFGSQSAKP